MLAVIVVLGRPADRLHQDALKASQGAMPAPTRTCLQRPAKATVGPNSTSITPKLRGSPAWRPTSMRACSHRPSPTRCATATPVDALAVVKAETPLRMLCATESKPLEAVTLLAPPEGHHQRLDTRRQCGNPRGEEPPPARLASAWVADGQTDAWEERWRIHAPSSDRGILTWTLARGTSSAPPAADPRGRPPSGSSRTRSLGHPRDPSTTRSTCPTLHGTRPGCLPPHTRWLWAARAGTGGRERPARPQPRRFLIGKNWPGLRSPGTSPPPRLVSSCSTCSQRGGLHLLSPLPGWEDASAAGLEQGGAETWVQAHDPG